MSALSSKSDAAARSEAGESPRDPRRWITLAIVLMATMIVVLDSTVLNVVVPTLLRDFHTRLVSLEWVITGYSLTFAAMLIIGGRLCDLYGTRRIFIIGAAVFGAGSLLASLSWDVPSLFVGEAIIEGLGASLMLPATLALLSSTFTGQERNMAFAAWGAVSGSAAALGPLVGGFFTTYYSWRWAFRVNVIVAPVAIVGAVLFSAKSQRQADRGERLDFPGAMLVAAGMFLLVFALSEGATYGWIQPVAEFRVVNAKLWPKSSPISIVSVAFCGAVGLLTCFYRYEHRRESQGLGCLFEFSLLRKRTFGYGLLVAMIISLSALGFAFTMALFLQEALHLSPLDNGLWMLPWGVVILVAAPLAGRLTHRLRTLTVVRIGLIGQAVGLAYIGVSVSTHVSFLHLLPGLVVYSAGFGFSAYQMTNIVLSEIPGPKSGVASGANTTVRQLGGAIGIAVLGTIVTVRTVHGVTGQIASAAGLTHDGRQRALAGVHAFGANYRPVAYPARTAKLLNEILAHAVSGAARDALLFAAALTVAALLVSLRVPQAEGLSETLPDDLPASFPLDEQDLLVELGLEHTRGDAGPLGRADDAIR